MADVTYRAYGAYKIYWLGKSEVFFEGEVVVFVEIEVYVVDIVVGRIGRGFFRGFIGGFDRLRFCLGFRFALVGIGGG